MSLINLMNLLNVTCGSGDGAVDIPGDLANIIHVIYNAIRIGVPIILIVVGMIGMGKAIAQQKEDEIKKAQSTLIKQAIAAVVVFLMLSLVSLIVGVVAPDMKDNDAAGGNMWNCIEKILKEGDTKDSATPSGGGTPATSATGS